MIRNNCVKEIFNFAVNSISFEKREIFHFIRVKLKLQEKNRLIQISYITWSISRVVFIDF